ncbi:MAG: efflux RND transporter periplasmic adaptor subunit [Pirellulaceae bacterium]|nr:efflux RND transporter periplasmic adaptor subunit [Pirellulaceae bacterium]
MKKSRWTKLPWVFAAVVLIGLIIYGLLPEPIQVEVAAVQSGSFQVIVTAEGATQVKERYMVTTPIAGKLVRLQLRAGDRVARGVTQLARIEPGDPSLLDTRYRAESQARERAAEASWQRAKAGLDSANEASEMTRHEFERAQQLQKTNAISQAEYDQAEHLHRISLNNTRSAEFTLQVCEHELALARVALTQFDPEHSANADNSMELTSPIDGTVLRVVREDGGVVSPGSEILEIGDLEQLEMKIDVLSQDAVKIPPHAKVVIDQWGGPGNLNGIVRRVEPAARTKISALGIEEKRVYVLADFTSPFQSRSTLGDGFRFEASIVIQETDAKSLQVPSAAIFRIDGQWYVFVVVANRAELRRVEVGATNGIMTQILSGLSLQDQIINHPNADIQPGRSVRWR